MEKHNMCNTRFYKILLNVRYRCSNKNCKDWERYGQRGIRCLWSSFQEYKEGMYKSYIEHIEKFGEKQTTLDRIDNNGHYCTSNCKWSTIKEQANNRSTPRKLITIRGTTKSQTEWANTLGISYQLLKYRLKFTDYYK